MKDLNQIETIPVIRSAFYYHFHRNKKQIALLNCFNIIYPFLYIIIKQAIKNVNRLFIVTMPHKTVDF